VAASVLVLGLSGAVLYVPALSEAAGQRFWVRTAHLVAAIALALAPALAAALRWPEVRAVERQLSRWDEADAAWFTRPWRVLAGGDPAVPPAGRFNAGQKLFAALAATALAALLVTGVPMWWWAWFGAALVARAHDLHVLTALALAPLIAGHVYLAVTGAQGRGGMTHRYRE
jgi:formate dehydrogenase subunit gamma